jgi:hypothetical protein
MKLATRRCLIHPDREAVARCPSCHQYFCRECVVEHESRFLCAACLRKSSTRTAQKSYFNWLSPIYSLLGLLIAYASFYLVQHLLLLIPPSIYNGQAIK